MAMFSRQQRWLDSRDCLPGSVATSEPISQIPRYSTILCSPGGLKTPISRCSPGGAPLLPECRTPGSRIRTRRRFSRHDRLPSTRYVRVAACAFFPAHAQKRQNLVTPPYSVLFVEQRARQEIVTDKKHSSFKSNTDMHSDSRSSGN